MKCVKREEQFRFRINDLVAIYGERIVVILTESKTHYPEKATRLSRGCDGNQNGFRFHFEIQE